MKTVHRLSACIIVLIVMFWPGVSWGQVPSDNDRSSGSNTAGGSGALTNNTLGGSNTAYGDSALGDNTVGRENTGFGHLVLAHNDGDFNSAVGAFALQLNRNGNRNIAVGGDSLGANESGNNNTGIGFEALFAIKGNNNTGVGAGTLRRNTTGQNNTAIGAGAGGTLAIGNNNIYIGSGVGPPGSFDFTQPGGNESRVIRVGTFGVQQRTFIAGIATVPTSNGATVMINTVTGQLGSDPSSARYKRDIENMGMRSMGLFELRPVTFRYKQDDAVELRYGLIAEEVVAIYPDLVTRGPDGQIEAVRYQEFITMLINELQQQRRQQTELKQRLERLEEAAKHDVDPAKH